MTFRPILETKLPKVVNSARDGFVSSIARALLAGVVPNNLQGVYTQLNPKGPLYRAPDQSAPQTPLVLKLGVVDQPLWGIQISLAPKGPLYRSPIMLAEQTPLVLTQNVVPQNLQGSVYTNPTRRIPPLNTLDLPASLALLTSLIPTIPTGVQVFDLPVRKPTTPYIQYYQQSIPLAAGVIPNTLWGSVYTNPTRGLPRLNTLDLPASLALLTAPVTNLPNGGQLFDLPNRRLPLPFIQDLQQSIALQAGVIPNTLWGSVYVNPNRVVYRQNTLDLPTSLNILSLAPPTIPPGQSSYVLPNRVIHRNNWREVGRFLSILAPPTANNVRSFGYIF